MVVDYSQPPKMVHFSGANPLDWVSQVERYFFCHSVSDSLKLPLASFFTEGEAREWYRNNQFRNWDNFVDQFLDRYRNWSREEPDKRLADLEEKNSNANHMFAEIPVTTVSQQIHDPNTCVIDGGISATTIDKVFEESSSDSEVLDNAEEIPFLLAPYSSNVAVSLKDERDAKVVAASQISSDLVDGFSGPADNSEAPLERSEILIGNSLNLIPLATLMVSIDCIKTLDNSLGVKYDEVESSQYNAAKVFATSPQLEDTSFLDDKQFRDCAMMRIFVSLFQSRKFSGVVDTTGSHKDFTRPIHGIEANTVQLWPPLPLPKPPFLALLFDCLEQVIHSLDLQKRLERWPLIWQYCFYDPLSFSRIHGVFRVENSWNGMGFQPNSFSYFNQLKVRSVKISSLEFTKHVLILVPIRFHPLDITQFLVLVRYWVDTGQRLEAGKFYLTLFPRMLIDLSWYLNSSLLDIGRSFINEIIDMNLLAMLELPVIATIVYISSRELIVGVAKHVHVSNNILDTHADAELLIGRGIIRCLHLGKNVKICYTTLILRDMATLVVVITDALATDQLALMSVKRKDVYYVNMLLLFPGVSYCVCISLCCILFVDGAQLLSTFWLVY